MLENLQSLFTIWTDVVVEVGEEASEDSQGDYLWHNNRPANGGNDADVPPEWPDATPEDGRKRVISNNDPIYVVNIREFVAERLRGVIERAGGVQVFQDEWVGRCDEAVVKAFVGLNLL
jgi:hypothetical protein